MLDQFVALAGSEGVDVVIIAGDVYDRSVPPADAVALLDDVLSRLVVDCGIPVVVIAGNHDSAERIGFGGGSSGGRGCTCEERSTIPRRFFSATPTARLHFTRCLASNRSLPARCRVARPSATIRAP